MDAQTAWTNGDLVLASGTIARHPFPERVRAAAAAGFKGIGLRNDAYLAAQTDSSIADVRAMLRDYAVQLVDLQPLMDWPCGGARGRHSRTVEEQAYRVAEALGGHHLIAAGAPPGIPFDVLADRFGALCDRAAANGLQVGLEFLPWTAVAEPGQAWSVVQAADRTNGGVVVDAWHFYRGSANEADLRAVPSHRIIAVHLDDAGAPLPDAVEDTRRHRRLPGEGSFPLVDFVRLLDSMGVTAPYAVEVLSDELERLPAQEAAVRAAQTSRAVLEAARRQQTEGYRA